VVLVVVAVVAVTIASGFDSSKPSGAAKVTASTTTSRPLAHASSSATDVTMSFVGDTDLGNTPQLAPSPSTYLSPVRAAIKAPIEFFNLEGVLTNSDDSKCAGDSTNCYAFRNPPAFARVYKSYGFTVANSANNHSHDFGTQGVVDTTAALHNAGIIQAGLPGQIGVAKEGSTTVAFVDFAPYDNTNDMLNYPAAAALIHKAAKMATVVVVYMHAGAEGMNADHVTGKEEYYVGEDRGNPEKFAKAAINAGADLVVASAPHTLRGMEFYRNRLIDYSMGDFACYGNFAINGTLDLSGVLHVTLSHTGAFVSASFTSTVLLGQGRPFVDPKHAAADFVLGLSRDDFGAAAPYIRANGQIVPPKS
jgi:poly-gamma-glutamate capsule biosynthesis protein CapA/YwtB (metallophosphatase superfamily)